MTTNAPYFDEPPCATTDNAHLFTLAGDPETPEHWVTERARNVCRACPFMARCQAHALKHDERWGVWGALSRYDRDRIRKREAARRQALIDARAQERVSA
jgi:WhiB family transcriptional regulator, redox-sensing transcriptional regulator